MTSKHTSMMDRMQSLQTKREKLLAAAPTDVMDSLLEEKNALEIVHSFPAQDLHLLINDIGPEDALPLLKLASNRQWEYFLDVEIWQKDRLDLSATTKWLQLMLAADPGRLARWCAKEKVEFTEYFLLKNIEVRVREYDQSPSEMGDDFFTFDDTFYFKFLDPPFTPGARRDTEDPQDDEHYLNERKTFLIRFLRRLSDHDHDRLQRLLMESASLLVAETEEEAYRRRTVRLAEKGFLPFEEAVGIYQPLTEMALKTRRKKTWIKSQTNERFISTPHYARQLLAAKDSFSTVLADLNDDEMLMQLQSEFAGLCNRILAADQKIATGRSGLHEAVSKAAGYIGIGLETIPGDNARLVKQYLLADIFRVGYGRALKLKWRAREWNRGSWYSSQGLPLSFWGEDWLGVLGGILIKRPLFFDNYRSGRLYREFLSVGDILETETVLDQVMAMDRLLDDLSLPITPMPSTSLLTYKNLLLTHWVKQVLDMSKKDLSPIPIGAFRSFYDTLWRGRQRPRVVRTTMKSDFLKWLTEKSGQTGTKITAQCGPALEALFTDIEGELGAVLREALDPRFIQLFLVS